jgi:hypothetical protein
MLDTRQGPSVRWRPTGNKPTGPPRHYSAQRAGLCFSCRGVTRIVPRTSEYKYKLSVAIAERLFFLDDKFNGLLYPAVAMRANAYNFALKLPYAHEHLRFQRAEYARINKVRDFGFDTTLLDTATDLGVDGSICWKGRLDKWQIREPRGELTFTEENGPMGCQRQVWKDCRTPVEA